MTPSAPAMQTAGEAVDKPLERVTLGERCDALKTARAPRWTGQPTSPPRTGGPVVPPTAPPAFTRGGSASPTTARTGPPHRHDHRIHPVTASASPCVARRTAVGPGTVTVTTLPPPPSPHPHPSQISRLAIHAAPSGTHRPPMPRSGLPWPHARPPLAPPASRVRCGAASHVAPRRPPCATVATATLDTRPTKRRQGATGDRSVVAATPSAAHASLALQCGTKQRGTLPHKAAQSSAVHGQVVVPSDDDNSRRLSGR